MERRLYRSQKDKIIAGVAGGLGEYFEVDPVIIRILFVVVTVAGGWGILAYVLCWVIIPINPAHQVLGVQNTPAQAPAASPPEGGPAGGGLTSTRKTKNVAGIILVLLGVLLLGHNLLPRFDLWEYWPVILVLSGIWLLVRAKPRTV